MGDSIAENIDNIGRLLRERKALRAVAVDYLHMDPEQVDRMNLGELTGHLQAAQLQSQQQTAEANRQYMQAHAEDLQAQGTLRQQQAQDDIGVQRGLQTYGRIMSQGQAGFDPGDTSGLPGPIASNLEAIRGYGESAQPTHEQAVNAALQASGGGRAAERLLDSLTRYGTLLNKNGGGQADSAPELQTYPNLPGYGTFWKRGSKEFTAVPMGQPQVTMLDAGDGTQIPVLMGGKGAPQQLRTAPEPKKVPDSFNAQFNQVTQIATPAQDILAMNAEELAAKAKTMPGNPTPASLVAAAKRTLQSAQRKGVSIISRYKAQGYHFDDDETNNLLDELGVARPSATVSTGTIPQSFVDYLKAHPESRASFDKKFGAGAAARYLK